MRGARTRSWVADAYTSAGAPGVEHRGGCWVAGPSPARVWVPLSRPVTHGHYVLDLRLTRESTSEIGFLAAGREPLRSITVSPEGRGADRWIVATAGFAAEQVGFDVPAEGRLCLAQGSVALAVPR